MIPEERPLEVCGYQHAGRIPPRDRNHSIGAAGSREAAARRKSTNCLTARAEGVPLIVLAEIERRSITEFDRAFERDRTQLEQAFIAKLEHGANRTIADIVGIRDDDRNRWPKTIGPRGKCQ